MIEQLGLRPGCHARRVWRIAAIAGWLALPSSAWAQAADSLAADTLASHAVSGGAPDSAAWTPDPELSAKVQAMGLENVTALGRMASPELDSSMAGPIVEFENRRYRHSAIALGHVAAATGGPALVYERRLGMVAAAIRDRGTGQVPTEVWYPSDGAFPRAPDGPVAASTRKSVDLLIGPLFTYELARFFDPVLVRVEMQPELRYNPWKGARLRAAVVIPVRNDFDADSTHPDVNRVRPGPVMMEQYAWSPGAALFSACGGLFGSNRYGMSLGLARPLRGGEVLLDSQTDFTGFFAVSDSGINYSTPSRWTGFVGVSYRPPGLDFNVRLRLARYIQEDQGYEIEVRRSMGDLDVSMTLQRVRVPGTAGEPDFSVSSGLVRLTLPIPPLERPVGWPVRVMPVERFPFQYREESLPIGTTVANLASREDYLKQLDRSSLASNDPRYQAARAGNRYHHREEQVQWVSMTGMTGFINTPWAGVMGDKELEFGYNKIPKQEAYAYRNLHDNEIYYAAMGFLPHIEVGLRWTVEPGSRPFAELVPESHYVDADRMFSVRAEVLRAGPKRPGLALGVEDLRGTRIFHSSFAVAGMPFEIYRLQNRVTLGYAPRVFEATRRTLDGLFGAYEVSVRRALAAAVEYDSEKFNAALGINLGFGLRARVAWLDLKYAAVGAGWFKAL